MLFAKVSVWQECSQWKSEAAFTLTQVRVRVSVYTHIRVLVLVSLWMQPDKCQKLWKLVDRRESICSNKRIMVFLDHRVQVMAMINDSYIHWHVFRECPGSGTITTFAQFLFIAIEGFIRTARFGRQRPVIPIT